MKFANEADQRPGFIAKFALPRRHTQLAPLTDELREELHVEMMLFDRYAQLTEAALTKSLAASTSGTALLRHHQLNCSHHDRAFIKTLIDDSSLTCKPADKNLGLVLVNTSWYEDELRSMLRDRVTYQRYCAIDSELVSDLKTRLYAGLQQLVKRHASAIHDWNEAASKQIEKFMSAKISKAGMVIPEIYLLIKVHKPKGLCGRPIVPCTRWITTPASILVDHLLQEIVVRADLAWLVKDTKSFVNELERTFARDDNHDGVFVTADIASLYTNIDTELGLRLVREFLTDLNVRSGHVELIMALLEFVMRNSYLSFKNDVYHQVDGTAMGTTCAPIYANIVAYQLEKPVIAEFKARQSLRLYRRYLDDIFAFIAVHDAVRFMDRMNSLHPKLKFEFVSHPHEAAFLDLAISKGDRFHRDGRFDLRVHQKKMNLYLYIPYLSFHTDAMKKSFIQTELMRYIRNTSSHADYNDLKSVFYQRLRDRGYPRVFLDDIFESIFYSDREWFLLPSKGLNRHPRILAGERPLSRCLLRRIDREHERTLWTPSQAASPPVFIIPYSPVSRDVPLRRILCDRWDLLQGTVSIARPIIAYQSLPNLMTRLVYQKGKKARDEAAPVLTQPKITDLFARSQPPARL